MLVFILAASMTAQLETGQTPAEAGATELFSEAKRAFSRRDYREALAKFEAAYRLGKSPVQLYNIGKCLERLGETGSALRHFREYLRLEPLAQRDDVLKGDIANAERRLKERGLQQVAVFVDPAVATVEVDGVRPTSTPAYVELGPGEHRFLVRADGYQPQERRLRTPLPGGSAEQSFILLPVGDSPRAVRVTPESSLAMAEPGRPLDGLGVHSTVAAVSPRPSTRPWAWVMGGLAVAAGGTAVGLGLAYPGADQALHDLNKRGSLTPDGAERLATGLAVGRDVAIGVAGAAALTAIILSILDGHPVEPPLGAVGGEK